MKAKLKTKSKLQSLEELKLKLNYNSETGQFHWLTPPRRGVGIDREAGYTTSLGYRQIRYNGWLFHCHKLAMYFNEFDYDLEVDHIDGQPFNNKWVNLQQLPHKQNMWKSKVRVDNKVGVKGVCSSGGKFIAYMTRHGKTKYLGSFNQVEDAITARLMYQNKEKNNDI